MRTSHIDSPPTPGSDDDFEPISALNDLLFCERRCALHRIEQIWVENVYTVEGTAGHQKAHQEEIRHELPGGGWLVRGMWLQCRRLRLIGKADVVEFHPGAAPFPVEYKRGRRRRWDNDDVQLCAQAICLEEMLGVAVPAGAIFHVRSKRRREVVFDPRLREQTEQTVARLHRLVASRKTPPAVLKPRCRGCSLHDLCMPEFFSKPGAANAYLKQLYELISEDLDAG